MAQQESKVKKPRGSRTSKKNSKKTSKTSASTSIIIDEPSLDQDDSISPRKQLSWNKDTNADGKTMLDLIVEWLGFTWGDQESQSDVIWMCMESHDTESTNFTRYRMGIPKKKECAEKCGEFLNANGFSGFTTAGIKQQIDSLDNKFRGAEGWRNDTGGGVLMRSNAEQEIEALHATGQWTIEREEEIRALTARTTNDILHSKCPYYNILLPVMGDRPTNEPLYAAESGMITQSSTENNLSSALLSPADETQATQYSGWDPTQSLDNHEDTLPDPLDITLPQPEDRTRTSSSNQIQHTAQSQTNPIPREGRSQLQSNPRTNPPASQSSNQSTNNISRRNSSSSSFLKSIQSSLPSQTDFKEMNENNKTSNENQRLMIEKVAGASQDMVSILGARYGFEKPNEKHPLEEEDLTPEAIARRKAKKAKQDELDIIKLDRELAQERKALEEHSRGSGLSKLELAREKIDIITKLAAVNIPYAEAERMADAVIEGLQK